jgi:hypothetical protein
MGSSEENLKDSKDVTKSSPILASYENFFGAMSFNINLQKNVILPISNSTFLRPH